MSLCSDLYNWELTEWNWSNCTNYLQCAELQKAWFIPFFYIWSRHNKLFVSFTDRPTSCRNTYLQWDVTSLKTSIVSFWLFKICKWIEMNQMTNFCDIETSLIEISCWIKSVNLAYKCECRLLVLNIIYKSACNHRHVLYRNITFNKKSIAGLKCECRLLVLNISYKSACTINSCYIEKWHWIGKCSQTQVWV